MEPLLRLGYSRALEKTDIPNVAPLAPTHASERWSPRWEAAWKRSGGSVWRALYALFGTQLILNGVFELISRTSTFVNVFALRGLIGALTAADGEDTSVSGFAYAVLLFASSLAEVLSNQHYWARGSRLGMNMRTCLIGAIYRKLVKVPANTSKGDVSTLVAVDANRLTEFAAHCHMLWSSPICLLVALGMTVNFLGWAAVPALFVGALLAPINARITKVFNVINMKLMKAQQKRMELLGEMLAGIQCVKLFSWEDAMANRITEAREAELVSVKRLAYALAAIMTVITSASTVMSLFGFVAYALLGGDFNQATTFSALYLFGYVTWPLLDLPYTIGTASTAMVSVRRLQEFFSRVEVAASARPSRVEDTTSAAGLLSEAYDDEKGSSGLIARQYAPCFVVPDDAASATAAGASDEEAAAWIVRGSFSWEPQTRLEQEKSEEDAEDDATTDTASTAACDDTASLAASVTEAVGVDVDEVPRTVLHDVTINIPKGKLVCVVGRVGSGKSSLLAALLGEMRVEAGTSGLRGSVAYVPQKSWIRSASLRSNVLCGMQLDAARYRAVLTACAMDSDLKQLAAGDKTHVGERGVTLSGGQKQRTALARAVYADADVYLLDDVMSALDAHVGRHIFDKVIGGPHAMLQGRTRVLVTHQQHFLPSSDLVVVMEEGRIQHCGTYSELTAAGVSFAGLAAESTEETKEGDAKAPDALASPIGGAAGLDADASELETVALPREGASPSDEPDSDSDVEDAEERYRGTVSAKVYKRYAASLGSCGFVALLLFTSVGIEVSDSLVDSWLAWFSAPIPVANSTLAAAGVSTTKANQETVTFLIGYCVLAVIVPTVSLVRHFMWFRSTYIAARRLHNRMLRAVLRAPMSWFDATPTGRVLNRFSKDQQVIDQELPDVVSDLLLCGISTVVKLVVITVAAPVFLFFVPILAVPFVFGTRVYRRASRELKRLDAISMSPVHSLFTESVEGLTSVRAFGLRKQEINHLETLVDTNNGIWYSNQLVNRWMQLRMQGLGTVVVLLVSVVAVLSRIPDAPQWLAGNRTMLALAITYAMGMTGTLNWGVQCVTRTESEMARVERCNHYAEIMSEAPLHSRGEALRISGRSESAQVPAPLHDAVVSAADESVVDQRAAELRTAAPHWPRRAEIVFDNVELRYRDDAPLVLNKLSFTAAAGERVAIVGRTGAGKSSLMSALFRIRELSGGRILIDGVDIASIGLRCLRSRLSIIPQEATLFSGTIRSNLDPNAAGHVKDSTLDDARAWEALERVGLRDFVRGLRRGLDAKVDEGGANVSLGQRQLLCLARALLRDTKVLVCDEATASVDPESDELIQATVRDHFGARGVTVLTIAHRLGSIIDYDRVAVLQGGSVVEIGSPAELLDAGGHFAEMVDSTGPASSAFLRRAAKRYAAERCGLSAQIRPDPPPPAA